ncbi:hypothetical protein EOVG_00041 [Emiliania huxleyi virus 88]|nr:hypothetical protein EOVG_00041 [Emiliania huxleyi virus 88]
MSGVIYYIQSPSGKGYVGKTDNFEERMRGHQKASTNCTLLKRAIDKYGWNNMKITILLKCKLEDMPYYEQLMVDTYDTFGKNGYNCTSGGEKNKVISDSMKSKISNTLRERNLNNPNMGSIYKKKGKGSFELRVPGAWTVVNKPKWIYGFRTKEDAESFRDEYFSIFIQNKTSISIDEHILDSLIFKYTTNNKKRQFVTGGIEESKNAFIAKIPKKWTTEHGQVSFSGFSSYDDANKFLSSYYENFVRDKDTPLKYDFSVLPYPAKDDTRVKQQKHNYGIVSWHSTQSTYHVFTSKTWHDDKKMRFLGRCDTKEEGNRILQKYYMENICEF